MNFSFGILDSQYAYKDIMSKNSEHLYYKMFFLVISLVKEPVGTRRSVKSSGVDIFAKISNPVTALGPGLLK